MRFFVFTALVVAAFAVRVPDREWIDEFVPEYEIKESAFRSGREYRFFYNGQLSTGIPMSSKQHSATRIQALVSLVFKTPQECLLQFSQVRMGKLNRRLPAPRAMYPFMAFEEVPIEQELKTKLQLPVKFFWNKGLISQVVFDGSEEPWSANMKRGVLNLLQVNLQKERRVQTLNYPEMEPLSEKMDFFRVTEDTLEGQCQVFYTVTSQPNFFSGTREVLNVTKTIDFERCVRRPEIKYNFRFSNPCPTCDDSKLSEQEKFLKSSTVMKFNISGTPENFLIESARIESQYTVTPFNEDSNVIITFVNQTLELVRTSPIETRIPMPRNPQPSDSDMIFSPDWDILKEKFFMEGEETFLSESPYSEIKNKIQLVSKLLREFVDTFQESVAMESPKYFTRLVKIFRMLKREELNELFNKFYMSPPRGFTPEEHLKIKNAFIDACAFAGTKDCVFLIVEKTMKREIDPLMASFAIKAFTQIRVVSKPMIEKLMTLAESEVCKRNFFLKQTCWLTIGTMVNSLCVDNEDFLATEFKVKNPQEFFCPKELMEKFTQKFFFHFEKCQSPECQVLFMKTISNAALITSIPRLEKIIKNFEKFYPEFIRTEAVLALRQLRELMPHKVRQILMPIYMNRLESPEMRIVCLYTIFQTMPPRPILDQISRKIFSERSRQVASFVHSYMRSMSNSTNPCQRRFATDMKLSLRHSRFIPESYMPGFSKYIHRSFFFPEQKFGFDFNFATVWSNRSMIPRRMAISFNPLFAGFWSKEFFTFGFHAEGFEESFWRYLGRHGALFPSRVEEFVRRSPRSAVRDPLREMKSIYDTLKIRPRQYFSEKSPMGHIYMKFRNQEFGFIPFSPELIQETINEMLESGSFNMETIKNFITNGFHLKLFKAFYLHEMSYKIPTTLGLPLRVSTKVPFVFRLTGKVLGERTPNNFKFFLENFKPSFVASFVTNMECWSPVVNSGLKIYATARAFTPFEKFSVFFNPEQKELSFMVQPLKEKVEFLHLETRPVTHTLVWPEFVRSWIPREEKTIMGEDWTRVVRLDEEFGREIVGINFVTRGFWHRTPIQKLSTTPFCPFSGPNKFVMFYEPGLEMPTEYILKLTADFFKPLREVLKPSFPEFTSFFEEEESFESFKPKFQRFINYEPSEKFTHFFKALLFTKGSRIPRKIELNSNLKCGEMMRFCKVYAQLEFSPKRISHTPFYCLRGETLFPESPEEFSELFGKKVLSDFSITWGTQAECKDLTNNFIKFKLMAERSPEQVMYEKESPYYNLFTKRRLHCANDRDLCSPIQEYQYMMPFTRLLNYRMDIQYSEVMLPVRSFFNQAFRYCKYFFFWSTQTNEVAIRNPEGRIRAFLSLDPRSLQYFNISFKTPMENVFFRDIPIPFPVNPFNVRRSYPMFSSFMETVSPFETFAKQPFCSVSSRRISTFDQVEYSSPLSTCWTVLAKDCGSPEEPRFSVLAKRYQPQSERKMVKILVNSHIIELWPETEGYDVLKLKINGEVFNPLTMDPIMEHGHVVCRVEKKGKYLKVVLPEAGIKVYFDGYTVNIKISQFYRSTTCGLCGHFDFEPEDEFRTPEWELTNDVREFHRSYILNDESCTVPELSEICTSPECEFEPFYYENEKIDTSEEELSNERPVRVTKVVEHGEKLCFSKPPVPVCPLNTYPIEFNPEKKIAFTCFPRHSFEAQEYYRRAYDNMEYIQEVRRLKSHFTDMVEIPKKCGEFFDEGYN